MKFLSDLGEQVYAQYTEIQREIIEISEEMLTDKNILDSIAKDDNNSINAKAIEELSNCGKIFLSIPSSEEGRKKRKALMMQVEGKRKYENWPYEIVPSIEETAALILKTPDEIITALNEYIKGTVYAIHVVSSENDLAAGLDKMQYDLTKTVNSESAFHKSLIAPLEYFQKLTIIFFTLEGN
jgi:hypothetical protein